MTLAHRDDREWLAQQMLQTNGQAFREDMEMLQEILRAQPAWVRDTINQFLQEEEARTFQNVVGQIELYKDMLSKIVELDNSEDAVALRNLIKDIHPSNMRGLQREAQSIGEEMTELRLCIGNQDWETMSGLMQRIKNKVRRFRDKFADLRPKLERLAKKVAELATECEENASRAEGLKHEVEARRDWWLWLLGNFGLFIGISSGVGLLGGGIAAVVLHVLLHQEYVALTAAMGTAAQASKASTAAAIALKAAGAKAATAAKAAAAKALAAHSAAATATGVAALAGPASIASAALMLTGPLGLVVGTAAAVGTLCGSMVSQCSAASAAAAASTAAAAATAAASKASAAATAAQAAAATAATANAQVTSLQTVIASMSGWAASCTPFIASTALLLALFMLGWLGRDLLKSLLGRLWAAEIKAHEYCAAEWRRLEQDLKTAAKQLRESTASCEELETCLDAMFEAAENASEILEDHNTYPRKGDLEGLVREVNELCSSYELAISAFQHVQGQVMSLYNHANNSRRPLTHHSNLPIEDDRAPSNSALSMLEHVQADGSSVSMLELQVEPRAEEVTLSPPVPVEPASIPSLPEEGWILVESEPLGTSTVSFSATSPFLSGRQDCIPGKTYLLVPIEFASKFGALRAAGPSGDCTCQVTEEESNQRLMSVFRLSDGEHRLTANHPLWVNRSGVWIQEEAARLHLGDSIVTTMGMEVLSKMPATLLSTEPVYRLDIESTHLGKGEVFICTSVNDNGHKRFSGIAVLSSPEQDNASIRASSAPPLRMSGTSSSDSSGFSDDLPSIGSRFHQEGCCRNVCKKFLRGRCEEAGECRFCHFRHPEESKRAPRGSRNNRGGAQSSNLS